jgi:hypothetical protein
MDLSHSVHLHALTPCLACCRTLDSFGVQYADVICDPEHYRKSHRLFNMQASVGAQRWLSLTEYRTAKCVYMCPSYVEWKRGGGGQ